MTKNRLKDLRKATGKTQKDFYSEIVVTELNLGVTLRTYQNWEKPENEIKSKPANSLANYFGVSTSYLLGYTKDSNTIVKSADNFQNNTERIQKGIEIYENYLGIGASNELKKEAIEYYTEHFGENSEPSPNFFADSFVNQFYYVLSDSFKANSHIEQLLVNFYSMPHTEWDRMDLLISSYSKALRENKD
ncbi:DNA-binding transcriptional regulator, XRE-family HTH domain [Streptococcus equinus]|uniref:helix-turn-helix domain-containing protein n=1 Tax=Streptococcus equinus TaxID=1335 RepID=UPI0008D62D75|nr:helix-turn-helix transcriptional regulator [Streptococcus equinus]SEK38286.1 DNA-binding transcriptional regulator, XRE-family HTH domain [Streptococcus equinus]